MMYPETLEESGRQLPYFRTEEFSEMMLDSEAVLKRLLGAADVSKVAFLTASGTGAMEATVSNLFTSKDRVLVIVGGGFGRRFVEICDVHSIPHDSVDLAFGEALTASHLDDFRGRGYTALLVNIDETSTGQLYDIDMLSDFCRSEGMMLVVDAISSFLADDLNMVRDGIDAIILSSQKALSLEPGISMVVVSPRAYDRIRGIRSPSYYLDLNHHFIDQERGQTPFTPAVGTLINLNRMLHMVESKGLDRKISETAALASYFREGARRIGIRIPDYPLSNAVTPIILDGNATEVYEALREHGITVTPRGGDLKPILLRVGHI
ncbi:MAG: pyridoxal-phosphate-dependent aminotransferase family protein, partial [Candidatus Methanomethylophilaceae archaeon]